MHYWNYLTAMLPAVQIFLMPSKLVSPLNFQQYPLFSSATQDSVDLIWMVAVNELCFLHSQLSSAKVQRKNPTSDTEKK
jgi:hypothetical protein